MSYLGIDIGTSSVKAVLIDELKKTVAEATIPLSISRPQPLYSEQDPHEWWQATLNAVAEIKKSNPQALRELKAIGLTGQMHGAVCLDKNHEVLCPAILWNDGRSHKECDYLNSNHPEFLNINGNLVMPGFTAPKILWLKNNQPEIFRQISKVLLPKDYIRFKLSGEFATDMSDASGTSWVNVKERSWSELLISICGLNISNMPGLYEGTDITGYLHDQLQLEWGLVHKVAIVAGGGDNAAGAVSVGILSPNYAMLSLGTSGVYFTASDKYHAPLSNVSHSFCHCLPQKWHHMGVILSAASCLSWWSSIGDKPESELIKNSQNNYKLQNNLLFLPYLSGERTPHNNPLATSMFWGLTHSIQESDLTNAILEGVAFAIADCQEILPESKNIEAISLIGGGAKSQHWGRILASVLNKAISFHDESQIGPAFGAALLAFSAVNKQNIEDIATTPSILKVIEPEPDLVSFYQNKIVKYRDLYPRVKDLY